MPDNKQGLGSLPPVCRQIAELKPAKVVFGPATFINTAVNGIVDEFAKRQAAAQRQAEQAARAARTPVGSGAATRRPSRSGSPGPRRRR